MKEAIRHWLEQNAQVPGLLAWGLRFPDREHFSQSCSEAFPNARLDQTWQGLAETVSTLSQHRISATRLRWAYEASDLYFAVRSDGICLGIFTTANMEAPAQAEIENLVTEFLAMPGQV